LSCSGAFLPIRRRCCATRRHGRAGAAMACGRLEPSERRDVWILRSTYK
jgi:hypothetical protein